MPLFVDNTLIWMNNKFHFSAPILNGTYRKKTLWVDPLIHPIGDFLPEGEGKKTRFFRSKASFLLNNKSAQYFILFFLISSLMGCTKWPPPSTGGYAGKLPLQLTYKSAVPNAPFHQRLKTYFYLIAQLRTLQESQVRRCYTARFIQMSYLAQQIAQETAAGLLLSADLDILLLENNIAAVWDYRNVTGCPKLPFNLHWLRLQSRIQ